MKGPALTKTGDDFEYEMTGENTSEEYWEILHAPFNDLRNIPKDGVL